MSKLIRMPSGGMATVSDARAERLMATGQGQYQLVGNHEAETADYEFRGEYKLPQEAPVEAPSEAADETNKAPEGDDTQEAPKPSPRAAEPAEIRDWAESNYDGDVPARGKLPRAVIEAYAKAHQN